MRKNEGYQEDSKDLGKVSDEDDKVLEDVIKSSRKKGRLNKRKRTKSKKRRKTKEKKGKQIGGEKVQK